MQHVLAIVSLIGFATSLFARAVDPIIAPIATDLAMPPSTVALLSTSFALPFALVQPILGPFADMWGKVRTMLVCLGVLVLSGLAGALSTNFALLLVSRVIAGVATGGIFPVQLAVVGDLVPVNERQIAIGRLLTFVITGNLLGASLAGLVADLAGWRSVFVTLTVCGGLALVAAMLGLSGSANVQGRPLELRAIPANYRRIFANPRAKYCYGAVFFEGIAIFGLFPYVGLLLLRLGEGRASIAGLVIGGFSIGGIVYSIAVRRLINRWMPGHLMVAGGIIAALGLIGASFTFDWRAEFLAFAAIGFGFYTLHGFIQVEATELSHVARGAAMSLHSCFFFLGSATGPVLYGFALAHVGPKPAIGLAAALVVGISLACAHGFSDRQPPG